MKHMGVLNTFLKCREVILKCDVDDRTQKKLELLDVQGRYEFATEKDVTCLFVFFIKLSPCEEAKGIWCLGSKNGPTVGRATVSE